MGKLSIVCDILRRLGLDPIIDDNRVVVKFEMKTLTVNLNDECSDEKHFDQYVNVSYHGFYKVDEEEIADVLVVCNKANRELRQIKTFLSEDLNFVSSAVEFWYLTDEDLANSINKALFMISHVRKWFMKELGDTHVAVNANNEISDNNDIQGEENE